MTSLHVFAHVSRTGELFEEICCVGERRTKKHIATSLAPPLPDPRCSTPNIILTLLLRTMRQLRPDPRPILARNRCRHDELPHLANARAGKPCNRDRRRLLSQYHCPEVRSASAWTTPSVAANLLVAKVRNVQLIHRRPSRPGSCAALGTAPWRELIGLE